MRYSGSLVKEEREKIFELFLTKHKLKFSDIEKYVKIRSNMLAYHLDKMVKEELLLKKGFFYSLSSKAEKYIPIFSNVTGKDLSATAALLVAVVHKDKVLLVKRDKRPYKGYWGVVGGKLRMEESLPEAAVRLAKEKTGLDVKFISANSILHERVIEKGAVKHGFLMVFVKVKLLSKNNDSVRSDLKWVGVSSVSKEKIIPSDLWLLKNKLNSKIEVDSFAMYDSTGLIKRFDRKKL